MKLEKEIPTWAYINFQLLYQINKAKDNGELSELTVSDLINNTSEHIGSNIPLESFYSPVNSGSVFSFLYSLLVVPKELFKKENYDLFKEFEFKIEDYFEIIKGRNLITQNFKIFRLLRNSISHVNYEIDTNDKFTVTLWNTNNGSIDFKLKSDIHRLSNFAVEIAKFYIANNNKE
ncbi:hypothetical protein KFE94_16470 [bacterium SCSIO 12643]|nr:hypothetical protein KFE94_16470 [bacterium SCSIO 12643]